MKIKHSKTCACATCTGAPIDNGTLLEGLSYEFGGRKYEAVSLKWVVSEGWWVYYTPLTEGPRLRLPLAVWNHRVEEWGWLKPHTLHMYNRETSQYDAIFTGDRASCIGEALTFLSHRIDPKFKHAHEDIARLREDFGYQATTYRHNALSTSGGKWPYGFTHLQTFGRGTLWLTIDAVKETS